MTVAVEPERMQAWQKGFPLARLRELGARFGEWDKGFAFGAFARATESAVAKWLSEGSLIEEAEGALIVARWTSAPQRVKDFTGEERLLVPRNALVVERVAGPVLALGQALRSLSGRGVPVAASGWVEKPETAQVFEKGLGLELALVKVRASSELVGVWANGGCMRGQPLPRPDWEGIRSFRLKYEPEKLAAEVEAASVAWEPHYSSYNVRRTWSAIALRSFGGSPRFIEKPAEMSKGWKERNPAALVSVPQWTEVAALLPLCRALAESLPAKLERVRLMRLAPGGGELSRHADITDRDAGTARGKLLRLHFPVVTNPQVRFRSWSIDGVGAQVVHMRAGEGWYLDTRKPHAAVNGGGAHRVHLVVDAWSSPELLRVVFGRV